MGEPGGSNAGGDDAFRVWTYALNCCLDDEHPPEQAGADQQALINDYVDLIVEELEADPDRLAAAAAQCRERADQDTAAGCPPHHGDVWGAYLAELGAARVRTAGADTSSRKRERLLRQIHQRSTPAASSTLWDRPRQWARNWRWLRKRRRLNPVWWWRRHQLRRALTFEHARRADDMLIVVANLHGDAIGKIGFESCAICQRGLVCKVETYPPYDGYGIGGLLVDAALAAGGRPSDGFSWYTTGQYADARGFWRTMARRHRTPFRSGSTAACAHMRSTTTGTSDERSVRLDGAL
ncbi:hypothetical protein GCM10009765_81030 [Fodinicola feengrottensis]|uniref:GNAT family N-acetyltransferase n=1 Tax=Fodinicola feengrottensis TaxID=435914 RepID=A0ABN2JAK0_9ACTN